VSNQPPANLRIRRMLSIDFARQTVDRCRHVSTATRGSAACGFRWSRHRRATYIADNLPTLRADVSTWVSPSRHRRVDLDDTVVTRLTRSTWTRTQRASGMEGRRASATPRPWAVTSGAVSN